MFVRMKEKRKEKESGSRRRDRGASLRIREHKRRIELRELLVRGGEALPEARRALLVLVVHQGHHGLQRLDLLAMPCNGLFFVFNWRPTGGHRLPLVWGNMDEIQDRGARLPLVRSSPLLLSENRALSRCPMSKLFLMSMDEQNPVRTPYKMLMRMRQLPYEVPCDGNCSPSIFPAESSPGVTHQRQTS